MTEAADLHREYPDHIPAPLDREGRAMADRPEDIQVGDTVEVRTKGVPAWKIPALLKTATVRDAEHLAALREDIAEGIVRGGDELTILPRVV